jgi:hypothetical protein
MPSEFYEANGGFGFYFDNRLSGKWWVESVSFFQGVEANKANGAPSGFAPIHPPHRSQVSFFQTKVLAA